MYTLPMPLRARDGGRTAANGGHPCGLRATMRAAGMWPASAKTSPAVVGGHGVPAGRALRCDTQQSVISFNSAGEVARAAPQRFGVPTHPTSAK